MAKISINQIASWRIGEVITEKKLNEVFSLIGYVINKTGEEIDVIVKGLNEAKLPTRWVGSVKTFSDIQSYLEEHKLDEQFQPPNNPLPTSGDLLYVENNSDDPNLPAGINPGRYLYLYQSDLDGTNGKWVLYNPFNIPNASRYNDGLMSKEDKSKLDELPDNQLLDSKFDNINNELTTQQRILTETKIQTLTNKTEIDKLKPRVSTLEQNKQDKATNLPNYKSKNVEDNLVEVKTLIDDTLKQEILIWDNTGSTVEANLTNGNGVLPIPNLDKSKLEPQQFIKAYFALKDADDLITTLNITFKLISSDTSYASSQSFSYNGKTYLATLVYENDGFTLTTFGDTGKDSLANIEIFKIIKDIGVSDYMWADVIENDIKDFLKNNLGVRRQVIVNHSNPDGFNGFKENEEFTLNFQYVWSANAINIYVGGIHLRQGSDWEEIPNVDGIYANKIKFLRDIDLTKLGIMEIEGVALVVNSFQLQVWNNKDTFVSGSIVLHNGKIFYAKKDNIGQEPTGGDKDKYWVVMSQDIDIAKLEKDIKDYVDSVVQDLVDKGIEQRATGDHIYFIKNNIETFANSNDAVAVKKFLVSKGAYKIIDDGSKVLLNIQEPMYEVLSNDDRGFRVKWLFNIYNSVLADIKVLTATPNEITNGVNQELVKYYKDHPNLYKELEYEIEENDIDKFLKKLDLTRSDVEIIDTKEYAEKTYVDENFTKNVNISDVETYVGYTLNGKKVYVKYYDIPSNVDKYNLNLPLSQYNVFDFKWNYELFGNVAEGNSWSVYIDKRDNTNTYLTMGANMRKGMNIIVYYTKVEE